MTIKFGLSAAGQKSNLLSGGAGERLQSVSLPSDHENFRDFLELAETVVSAEGEAVLDTTVALKWWPVEVAPTCWDHTPSLEELFADHARRLAELDQQYRAGKEKIRQETEEVLRQRKTYTRTCDQAPVFVGPAWPQVCDDAVRRSPEALAWLAELEQANEEARRRHNEEVERAREEEQARRKAEQEEFARRVAEENRQKQERRAELNLRDWEEAYATEAGALLQVPIWSAEEKNTAAIISLDYTRPGGLRRHFLRRARGEAYYLLPEEPLRSGTPLEFRAGAEWRHYAFVVRVEADCIVLRECQTGREAIKAGQEFAEADQ
jgi:hypothetical protein